MSGEAERILEIVCRLLASGKAVDVDGLGVFRPLPGGGYEFVAETRPRVFIAYVEEDLALARRLSESLAAAGCDTWLDKEQLIAGQNWPRAIERAISVADAFVPCFSPRSIVKRGHFQSELRFALQCATRVPVDSVFLVPVRLERCSVPGTIASQTQYVDLFPDWEHGVRRVAEAVAKAGEGRGARFIVRRRESSRRL